jgi:hypothetical protein
VVARSEVRLDGWQLTAGGQRDAPPGWHLVQYLGSDGSVSTEMVEVAPGTRVEVGPVPRHARLRTALTFTGTALVGLGGAVAFGEGALARQAHMDCYAANGGVDDAACRSVVDWLVIPGAVAIGLGASSLIVGASLLGGGGPPIVAVQGRW